MADEILKIGAEFDVSPIIAGAEAATTAFDKVTASSEVSGNAIAQNFEVFQKQGLSAEDSRAALVNLGYSETEVAAATQQATVAEVAQAPAQAAVAATAETAAIAEKSYSTEALQARVATDLLTGQVGRSEQALIRFASHIGPIGALMQAAFPVFAVTIFATLIEHVADKIKDLSDHLAGYTESVKKAYTEDVKFSESALSHALTLAEAETKLTEIVREQGVVAQETFADKWTKATETASDATIKSEGVLASLRDALVMTAKDPFAPFEALIGSVKGLANAESEAADQAARLTSAHRTLVLESLQKEIDLDREAAKLIDAKTQAENASLTGGGGRVQAIQNEIVALHEKQRVEEEIAVKEAGEKAIQLGGDGLAAEKEARARVAQEYEYKQIELTGKLSVAEQEYARQQEQTAYSVIDTFRQLNDAKEKNIAQTKKLAETEDEYFARTEQHDQKGDIEEEIKKIESTIKYQEEIAKITEQTNVRRVASEQAAVNSSAQLEEAKSITVMTSEQRRLQITEQINQEVIAKTRKLEEEKLAVELDYLERLKAIQLGGVSEQEYTVTAAPDQLAKLAQVNSQIVSAKAATTEKLADLDNKQALSAIKSAQAQEAAFIKTFAPINRAIDGMVQGVLQGTQTISQAFARMGANIGISTTASLAQAAAKHLEHALYVNVLEKSALVKRIADFLSFEGTKKAAETTAKTAEISSTVATETAKTTAISAGVAAQTTAIVAGEATKHATLAASNAATVAGLSAVGAAAAFESVLVALPFPVNVATAPEVAAAEAAQIIAIGAAGIAEKGAVVPKDMPIFAHASEMILPPPISVGLQNVMPAMNRFSAAMDAPAPAASSPAPASPNVHVNISALDSKSIADFMHGNRAAFTQMVRTAVRNGIRV